MSSAFQWIQFAIINNLIMKYGRGKQMLMKGLLGIPKIITSFSVFQILQRWLNNCWLDFSGLYGYLRALHLHFHKNL